MRIRPYCPSDCGAMAELFFNTVHTVNAADYTPRQLDAWADGQVDLTAWDRSFRAHCTLVPKKAACSSVLETSPPTAIWTGSMSIIYTRGKALPRPSVTGWKKR